MKRVQAMIPAIDATTIRLLDQVASADEFDLIHALVFPLPATIVFALMGVPERDHPQLKEWCGYRAAIPGARARSCSYGWRQQDEMPQCSRIQINSISVGRTLTGTWPSGRASTTAWGQTWASWRPRSP
jgi:cytochrome P450